MSNANDWACKYSPEGQLAHALERIAELEKWRAETEQRATPETISASNVPKTGQIPPFEDGGGYPNYDYWQNRANYYEQHCNALSEKLEDAIAKSRGLKENRDGCVKEISDMAERMAVLREKLEVTTERAAIAEKEIRHIKDPQTEADAKLGALVREMPKTIKLFRSGNRHVVSVGEGTEEEMKWADEFYGLIQGERDGRVS